MENQSKGLAIASLIIGILAVVLSFCLGVIGIGIVIGIVLSVVGLILGIIALVKKQGGMAIAGVILNVIAVLFTVFWTIAFAGALATY